jgi:undecaprenyl-diphosphatase
MQPKHRIAFISIILLIAVLLLLKINAIIGPTALENFPLNREIFAVINGYRSPVLDTICGWVVFLGKGEVLIPLLILLIIYKRDKVQPFIMAIATNFLVVELLKKLFYQARPSNLAFYVDTHVLQNTVFNGYVLYNFAELQYKSFPSGDVAQTAALAAVLWPQKWQYRILLVLFVLVIAWERMYAGVHFPLDVTAAVIIGGLCGYITRILLGSHIAGNGSDEKRSGQTGEHNEEAV